MRHIFKSITNRTAFIFFIIICLFSSDQLSAAHTLPDIKDLNIKNDTIKAIRTDIRNSLYIIKSAKNPTLLPELNFYKYKIKKSDNLWNILSRTSLDVDTLLSVNALSSPLDISCGKTIYIPNMRGIIHATAPEDTLDTISKKYGVHKSYISSVNNIQSDKKYLFIPCGNISGLDRSLFMGTGFICPVINGRQSSNFGRRIDPFYRRFSHHTGIDIACVPGSEVHAARDGVVSYVGYNGGYGLLIGIKHENGYYSYYGHLKNVFVKPGTAVKSGDPIALSGNSGRSTGPHLHFEIRRSGYAINPGMLLKRK